MERHGLQKVFRSRDFKGLAYGILLLQVITAVGTLGYLFSILVALSIDSDLNTELRKNRLEKQIAQMKGHYIVWRHRARGLQRGP